MEDIFCSVNHVLTAIFCSVNHFWRGGFFHNLWKNKVFDFEKDSLNYITHQTWFSVQNRTWWPNNNFCDTVPLIETNVPFYLRSYQPIPILNEHDHSNVCKVIVHVIYSRFRQCEWFCTLFEIQLRGCSYIAC